MISTAWGAGKWLRLAKRHTYMTQRQRNWPTVFYSIADKHSWFIFGLYMFRHGGDGSGVTWRVTPGMYTRGALSWARACGRRSDDDLHSGTRGNGRMTRWYSRKSRAGTSKWTMQITKLQSDDLRLVFHFTLPILFAYHVSRRFSAYSDGIEGRVPACDLHSNRVRFEAF